MTRSNAPIYVASGRRDTTPEQEIEYLQKLVEQCKNKEVRVITTEPQYPTLDAQTLLDAVSNKLQGQPRPHLAELDQLEKIGVKPEVKIEPDANAKVKLNFKGGEAKGESFFDNHAGRVAEATSEATMQAEVLAGGMTINMNITQNTTLRLKGGEKSKKSQPKD